MLIATAIVVMQMNIHYVRSQLNDEISGVAYCVGVTYVKRDSDISRVDFFQNINNFFCALSKRLFPSGFVISWNILNRYRYIVLLSVLS